MPQFAHLLVLGGALLGLVLGSAPTIAQVTASPEALEATVRAGQAAEVALTVANGGADSLRAALSLAPADAAPADRTEPGDTLFTSAMTCCGLGALTLLPDGHVLVADLSRDSFEFTSGLEFVREFEHPATDFLSSAVGLTYSPDTRGADGSLWWMDVQSESGNPVEVALLEGGFDGEPTGRTLPVPWSEENRCGYVGGRPAFLAYDTSEADGGEGLFYYLDIRDDTVWAIDTLGTVADGYPVTFSDYAYVPQPDNPEGCLINGDIDAHALSNTPGAVGEPLLEAVLGYPYVHPINRAYAAVVLDRRGRNRGAETPLFDLPVPDGYGNVLAIRGLARSREDPSVLYLTVWTGFVGSGRYWVYAVRAAPLPPVWLHAEEILLSVAAGSEREVTLTLDASGLEPGLYEGVVSVREGDGIGPVVAEVPVALTVTPATDTEGEAERVARARLSVYPNPSAGAATVTLSLAEAGEVRVSVVDVLGREVVVLHDGSLRPGANRLTLERRGLPSGVYVVRATGSGIAVTQRVTLVR